MGALLIIGGALGLATGAMNAWAKQTEFDQKKKELETAKTNLKTNYDLAVENANGSANDRMSSLDANIANTKIGRDASLFSGANSLVDQNELTQMQIAELQVEAAEATGAAEQSLATSGVQRRTDSEGRVMNAVVQNTANKAGRSIAKARAQATIQLRQGFRAAATNYMDANMSIASYKDQIQYTKNELARTLKSYKTEYDQQKAAIDEDLDYMNSAEGKWYHGLSMGLGILSDTFSGIMGGFNMQNSYDTYRSYHPKSSS